MVNTEVIFYNATDWSELSWYNSGGTRAKRVLQSPDGKKWYFKCSEKKSAKDGKPEKYYKYEFWSEVIASQLGILLGLDVLRYDVAIHNGEIGCISQLMIRRDEEQLLEVGRYMTAINPDFLPENTKTRYEYTFELLGQTLNSFKLTKYWEQFLTTLLFDAIIGNTDRHQENWAFIGKTSVFGQALSEIESKLQKNQIKTKGWIFRNIFNRLFDVKKNKLNKKGELVELFYTQIIKMAPIYDNGSSLARELSDERVSQMLADNMTLSVYIDKGLAELHWQKRKISHFELIENLLESSYLVDITRASGFLHKWKEERAKQIINNIDMSLPADWHNYHIPEPRKALILKLLTLRTQKLKQIFDVRV